MRENLLEMLEKEYPEGFLFLYMNNGEPLVTGLKIKESDTLSAIFHLMMAASFMINQKESL